MKSIRETFLPDEGCVFVRVDLSQVEDRVGKMYCGTKRMVEMANTKPWEYDAHTENARAIFGKQEINKQERYLGKKVVHASWRDMGPDKLSESISKDTDGELFVPAKQCSKMIGTFLDKNWEIRDIYMPWVRQRIIEDGILVNSWGRRFDVRGRRIDNELFRKGYSFYPQSECCSEDTEILTKKGWVPFKDYNGKDEIACSTQEGNIHFELPKKLIKKKAGKLLHFEGTRVSQLVTPSHRMLYFTGGKPRVKLAFEIKDYARPQFLSCGNYREGRKFLLQSTIGLLAALQADGYIRGNAITWHFSKKRKVVRLKQILETCRIPFTQTKWKDGTFYFYVRKKDIPLMIWAFLRNKKYLFSELLKLDLETMQIFIEELKYWDGSSPESNPNSFWYDSTIKQNSEAVQAIAVLCGYRATLKEVKKHGYNSVWRVYLVRVNKAIPSKVTELTGNFIVYCVTVSTGYFLIRHNGKVSITGNCADIENMWGVVPCDMYMMARYGKGLNAQVHDEVIASVPVEEAWDFAMFAKVSIERKIEIPKGSGNCLVVPAETTVGMSYGEGVEFKRLPEREEFDEKVRRYLNDRKTKN